MAGKEKANKISMPEIKSENIIPASKRYSFLVGEKSPEWLKKIIGNLAGAVFVSTVLTQAQANSLRGMNVKLKEVK